MVDLEKLKKQKICHLKLELPLENLKRLMEFWFNNPDSDYNIEKNFSALQEKHEAYFSLVDEFAQSKLSVPSTLNELEKALDELGQAQDQLAKLLGEVVLADAIFAYSLDTLIAALIQNKEALENIAEEFLGLRNNKFRRTWRSSWQEGMEEFPEIESVIEISAYPELKEQCRSMLTSIRAWIDEASYMKEFILEANRKRSLVFEIVRGKLELFLQSEFARLSEEKLEELKDTIDAILAARDLLIEIESWWFDAAMLNGFGGGLKAKYLQFEKPLCIMRSDYAKGLSFHQKIDALDSLPPMTKDTVKEQLQNHLDTLKAEIDELVSGGWQECLKKQKRVIEARKSMGAGAGKGTGTSLSSECRLAIENFESKSSKVKNLASFRTAEEAYKRHINACSL